uniref:Uncharacterized protein n=1 Tax=Rhizophora mucronata TaxID=61149 RepID=A0A2P2PG54_RHIMU
MHAEDIVGKFMETYKPHVRDAISKLIESKLSPEEDSVRLGGIFVDLFSTAMIDVANEFGTPSYVFFTSSAAFLSLLFYLQT